MERILNSVKNWVLSALNWDEVLKSAVVAVATTAGTMVLKFIEQGIVNLDKLASNPGEIFAQVLAIQAELMLITFALLVSAYFAAEEANKGRVVPPLLIGWSGSLAIIHVLLIIAAAYKRATGNAEKLWITNSLTIVVPDILGLLAIGWAVYAARGIRRRWQPNG